MKKLEDRPPYVEFEVRTLEDRNATIEKGEFVGYDVDFAIIMPAGAKDKVERVYSEWIAYIKEQAKQERFPFEWIQMIEAKYKAWKNGTPPPSFGTPIKGWKHATPNDLKALAANHVTTIEELAVANEELIKRLGMGARKLKDKAILYCEQKPIPEDEVITVKEEVKTTAKTEESVTA